MKLLTRQRIQKWSLAILAPIVFICGCELVFWLAGVHVQMYKGVIPTIEKYWIVYESGNETGFQRAIPRNYRYFPERLPNFVKNKPGNGLRVFVLGESTTQGFPLEIGAFSDWLQVRLSAMLPDKVVEVVNAGNAGWYSEQILALFEESLSLSPDCMIWMSGHNEALDTHVRSLQFEFRQPTIHWLKGKILNTRTATAISGLMREQRATVRVEADTEKGVLHDVLPLAKKHFRARLLRAAALAKKQHVPVIFCTMPKNVRDCAPTLSVHSEGVLKNAKLRELWNTSYRAGQEAHQRGDSMQALTLFAEAERIDPHPANLMYALAQVHDANASHALAREYYLRAVEQDGSSVRAQEWAESTIREVARESGSPLVDVEELFNRNGRLGLAGSEWIIDYAHPSFIGNEKIADALIPVLESTLNLSLRRELDIGSGRGRELLGINRYEGVLSDRAECLASIAPLVLSNTVNPLWHRVNERCHALLKRDPSDWEITCALAFLEVIAKDYTRARERIESAISQNYMALAGLYGYYKTEPAVSQILDQIGFNSEYLTSKLRPEDRRAIEQQVKNVTSRR
ncbi:MAG: hypothetical protein ACKVS6_15405 [Planctomycetota bacterium]